MGKTALKVPVGAGYNFFCLGFDFYGISRYLCTPDLNQGIFGEVAQAVRAQDS